MKAITENTLLPLGLVIAIIGGVGWLTNMHYIGTSNAAEIVGLKEIASEQMKMMLSKQDETMKAIHRIEERTSIIETKIDRRR